jgi:hypothetical protein
VCVCSCFPIFCASRSSPAGFSKRYGGLRSPPNPSNVTGDFLEHFGMIRPRNQGSSGRSRIRKCLIKGGAEGEGLLFEIPVKHQVKTHGEYAAHITMIITLS